MAEVKAITGQMIYYYMVCPRKLWYFYHNLPMEDTNENVEIGHLLDENSYERSEKHLNIDNVINIDFIADKGVLHEIKKSKKIEQANIWQVKYYLYYLEQKGVTDLKGKIDYPLLKDTVEVVLTEADREELEANIVPAIRKIVDLVAPPVVVKRNMCKKCAYYDLCYI